MSTGITARKMPDRPPITNVNRKPQANSIGVVRWITPRHSVATHEKILIPVGTAIAMVVNIIGHAQPRRHARREHVVRPDGEAEHADRDRRDRDQLVAEDRLARVDREHLGDDPEPGQHHDVHGRVRVEPEDVLVHDDVAAVRRIEEVRAHDPVEQHQELGAGDERRAQHDQRRGGQVGPHEQRHPPEAHARSAHGHDGDQEVDGGRDRRRSRRTARPSPRTSARGARAPTAWRSSSSRRRTARPGTTTPCTCPATGSIQNESAFRRGKAMSWAPIMIGMTKLPEPGERGDDEQEDHQRRVHREERVVGGRREVLQARRRQLGAHALGQHAADDEEDERRHQVLDADHLVVGVDLEVVLPRVRAPWLEWSSCAGVGLPIR